MPLLGWNVETNEYKPGVSDIPDRREEGSVPALPVSSPSDELPGVSAAGTSGEAATAVEEGERPRSDSPISVGGVGDIALWAVTRRGYTYDLESFVEMFEASESGIKTDLYKAELFRRRCRSLGGVERKIMQEIFGRIPRELENIGTAAIDIIRHLLKRRCHYVKVGREADARANRLEEECLRLEAVVKELEGEVGELRISLASKREECEALQVELSSRRDVTSRATSRSGMLPSAWRGHRPRVRRPWIKRWPLDHPSKGGQWLSEGRGGR